VKDTKNGHLSLLYNAIQEEKLAVLHDNTLGKPMGRRERTLEEQKLQTFGSVTKLAKNKIDLQENVISHQEWQNFPRLRTAGLCLNSSLC